ncbi:hypothetical protein HPP92_005022 [Vanilla planifolia]|uniref:Uncharacterized protein n=1 Tax=Vanilla planifolia TaxID=51239 RepID=A0A835RXY4_VANPL|nr:hypothetical protein HPP92_005022 [Vanilla planifolia]
MAMLNFSGGSLLVLATLLLFALTVHFTDANSPPPHGGVSQQPNPPDSRGRPPRRARRPPPPPPLELECFPHHNTVEECGQYCTSVRYLHSVLITNRRGVRQCCCFSRNARV